MGLWPVAITAPNDPGSESAGKAPIGKGWGKERPTETTLRKTWRTYQHAAGVGLKIGKGGGIIDVEIDGEAGEDSFDRLMGDECVPTMGWSSNLGPHTLFRWDDRLSRWGKSVLRGAIKDDLPGLEIRLGAWDPDQPHQFQSVCPPSPMTRKADDGRIIALSPRVWNGVWEIAELPDTFFEVLDRILLKPAPSASIPRPPVSQTTGRPSPEERARLYLEKIPEAIEHQHGHDRIYHAACVLVDLFALSFEQALPILWEWNLAHAVPPESEKQIRHKLTDTVKNVKPSGALLNEDRPWFPRVYPYAINALDAKRSAENTNNHATSLNGGVLKASKGVNGVTQDDESPISVRVWPTPPVVAAWHGAAGDLAQAVDSFTEADPVGVMVQTLVAFGNMVGRKKFFEINATRHYPNLFVCTAGPTSLGRKGTAWDIVKMAMSYCDPDWVMTRVTGGLVSGEGLIWEVRDPVEVEEEVKEGGVYVRRIALKDAGVSDKRLLTVETELGGTLKILTREGNTLSALIRQCWDSGFLRSMAKNNQNRATDAHVSIIGHITEHEVARYLSQVDAANGFANRFLWVAVRQSKYLPDGARIPHDPIRPILDRLKRAHEVCDVARINRDGSANELWHEVYPRLCQGKIGLLGAIVGRAPAQVMRLALVYALIDMANDIRKEHLEAALALWDYCERSANYIFGDSLGDKDADHLLSILRSTPVGLSRTQIREDVFNKNKSAKEIASILGRLLEFGRIRLEIDKNTGGAPRTTVYATESTVTPLTPLTPLVPPENTNKHAASDHSGIPDQEREPGSDDDEETPGPVPRVPPVVASTRRGCDWLVGYLYREPARARDVIAGAGAEGIGEEELRASLSEAGVTVTFPDDEETWDLKRKGQ
jgi:hypothetical protein